MRLAAIALMAWIACAPAFAQPAPAQVLSAGITQTQWNAIRRQAAMHAERAQISETALLAAAQAASLNLARSNQIDPFGVQRAVLEAMSDQADQIAELERRLEVMSRAPDAATSGIFEQARAALDQGRLAEADSLLAQAAERELAAMQQADAEIERRRLRAGETMASRGQVAFVQADYVTAAAHYARAASTVPQSAIPIRWRYHFEQANALFQRASLFSDSPQAAVRLYEEVVLPLAPRQARPDDWAATQHGLGEALRLQGARGEASALARSVAAFEAALTVRTRAANPQAWADTQFSLGIAHQLRGDRGALDGFGRAVQAFEAALTVRTLAEDPSAWAETQSQLASVLSNQGDDERAVVIYETVLRIFWRETEPVKWAQTNLNFAATLLGRDQPHRALVALEFAAEVMTRETNPNGWASIQNNLGLTHGLLGDVQQSVAAYEAALTVLTPQSDPASWALAQMNLGTVYTHLGVNGQADALPRAEAAYQAILAAISPNDDPRIWAGSSFNLALTYRAMGRHRDARTSAQRSLAVFERVEDAEWVERVRSFLSRLPAQ